MPTDLIDLARGAPSIAAGARRSGDLPTSRSPPPLTPSAARHAFIRTAAKAPAVAAFVDAQQRIGALPPPLAGLAVSVKDLFDVAGHPTTGRVARCATLRRRRTTVPRSRLRWMRGAALVGHTNMTESAYRASASIRITVHRANPATAATMPRRESWRSDVGGGGVGRDRRGLGRAPVRTPGLIPAAPQGVGSNAQPGCAGAGRSRCRRRWTPWAPITRSVDDAVVLHEVLAGEASRSPGGCRPGALRLVKAEVFLDDLEPAVAAAFAERRRRRAGVVIDLDHPPELRRCPACRAVGGFAGMESWAWHRRLLAEREADFTTRAS